MKNKIKIIVLFLTFLFSLLLFLGTIGVSSGINTTSLWDYIVDASAETKSHILNYSIKNEDTFSTVMEKFDFSGEEINEILSEAEDVYDFSSIKAGNLFQFIFQEDLLTGFKYDLDRENQIVVETATANINVYEDEIFYDQEIREISGEVNTSLFLDGIEAGLSEKTILELAEIFAWDVDFSTDIREGDEFSVVYRDLYRDGVYVGPGRIMAGKFVNQDEEHYAYYFENGEDQGKYFNEDGESVVRQFLKSPLDFARITSGFSYNRLDPVTRSSYGAHRAIDYGAPRGTSIRATGDGRVSFAGWGSSNGLGIYVKISHGGVYDTIYAHLSDIANSVSTGSSVYQGQIIGYVGSTGYATGPHLHYEMHKYGGHINPLTEEFPAGDPVQEDYMDEFKQIVQLYKSQLD
ncbi:MAG: M23 family metallopeptidase [Candidatus Paceibacterota bacterium]